MAETTSSQPGETVRAILDEARRQFAERGFDGVSINDLASAVGVSKANIFHHFGAKEALYIETLKACLIEFGEVTDGLRADASPIEQRLANFMLAHAERLERFPEAAQVVLRELLQNRSEVTQQLAEEVTSAQFRRLFDLLQEAQQAGEIRRDVDPTALMLLMIGVVVFLFQVRALLGNQPEVSFTDRPEEFSQLFADILVNGVSPARDKQGRAK